MPQASARAEWDSILLPFIRAACEDQAQFELAQIIEDHADEVIRNVLRRRLRSPLGWIRDSVRPQDASDLRSEVLVQLLTTLRSFREGAHTNQISDFRNYVAAVANNVCTGYLRQKYPQRHRLKDRLRYALKHHKGLALWECRDRELLSGFDVWRQDDRPPVRSAQVRELRANPRTMEELSTACLALNDQQPGPLLTALFNRLGGPLKFDDAVDIVADLWNIKDRPPTLYDDAVDRAGSPEVISGNDRVTEIEQRRYIEALWNEILQLPLDQRVALLLNLRDAQGRGVIALLVDLRIVRIREMADALAMSPDAFLDLWDNLPLGDETIARTLGISRQQVINLRLSARRRLRRRMKKLG